MSWHRSCCKNWVTTITTSLIWSSMEKLRKNWIKHGKILSLVKINSAKTQLTQFSLSCCQRADFSVLSQKRWDKLALFYKHNTNPNENSQFKHWFYIRSYRVKLNSSVGECNCVFSDQNQAILHIWQLFPPKICYKSVMLEKKLSFLNQD